jgi:acetylornithine deacetylase/succinyl-diaminopimelate desuccinylase-like protein
MSRAHVEGHTTMIDHQIRDTLINRMATHRIDLERLIAIPSVSASGFDVAEVRRCAEVVRDLLTARGCNNARLLEIAGAHPAVYADWLGAGDDRPTVLCYAHYDVQPPGDLTKWTAPPFEPTERDGRLFGRGAADDKAGIMVHVAAIDAWLSTYDRLPVNVKVIIEGEEETGSEHLQHLLDIYGELLRADVVVITDSTNWKVGVPALTHSLRGLVDCVVEVRALDHPLHSGMYGGPVPDPLTGLIKLLSGMTDDDGVVTIPGFADDAPPMAAEQRDVLEALGFDLDEFRDEAGLLDGVELVGSNAEHVLERLWYRPTITVIGLDAPAVAVASNTLAASARAKVSARLAPGQDPKRALDVLVAWLEQHALWGLQVSVTPGAAGAGYLGDPDQPAMKAARRALQAAYDHEVALIGVGGSIPLIEPLTRGFGDVPALLTGVEDPDTRAHGIDESLHIEDWQRACLAHAYLFAELATELAGSTT